MRTLLAMMGVALVAGACQRSGTQLLARVETDFVASDPLTAVEVVVQTPAGETVSDRMFALARPGEQPAAGRFVLPLSTGIVPRDGDVARRVRVIARGLGADGRRRVQRSALTGFVRGATLLLPLFLPRACADVDCPTGTTCVPSAPPACVSDTVPPGDLVPVPPGERDGGEFALDATLALDGPAVPPLDADATAPMRDVVMVGDAHADRASAVDAVADAPRDAWLDALSDPLPDAPADTPWWAYDAARDATVPPGAPARLALGGAFTTYLHRDGTLRVWGANNEGQLGNGSTTQQDTPGAVAAPGAATQQAAGGSHTCARGAGGAVVCWGNNSNGQLGDGTVTRRLIPGATPRLAGAAAEVRAGELHTCARLDEDVQCWGGNGDGQVGAGTLGRNVTLPTTVPSLSNVAGLALGASHTCALLRDGTLRCWGRNAEAQLGDGSVTSRLAHAPVMGLAGVRVVQVAAGLAHTCALASDGRVFCWGANDVGQLGTGTPGAAARVAGPVTGITNAVAITVGGRHSCALLADGGARCWGPNGAGQLGDGTTTPRALPTPVVGLPAIVEIAAGGVHTCALSADETVRCWGANMTGQVGDGTTTNRSSPVRVLP